MFNSFDDKFDNDAEFRKQLLVQHRRREFTTPAEMGMAIDRYINLCIATDTAPTYTGLVLALGLSSRARFEKYRQYEGYEDEVDRGMLLIEHEYEKRLVANPKNTTGPIFALKQFGWKERTTHELVGEDGGPILPPAFNVNFPQPDPSARPIDAPTDD